MNPARQVCLAALVFLCMLFPAEMWAQSGPPTNALSLWLSADSGVTLSVVNGNPTNSVLTWADQSGQNNNAGWPTGYLQPVLSPNLINGKPAVSFQGSAMLTIPTLTTWNAGGEVLVVVASAGRSSGNSGMWNFGSADYTSYNWSNGGIYDSFGTTGQYNEGVPNQDITQFHIYQASSKAGLWQSWIDGVTNFVSHTNTVGFATVPALGGNGFPGINSNFAGEIAEILVYNRTLTLAERWQAWSYLAQKYALAPSPAAPTNVQVSAINTTTALVSWDAPINSTNTSYNVMRQENGGSWVVVSSNSAAQTFVDTGLTPTSNYSYTVQTVTSIGQSSWTSPQALNLNVSTTGAFPLAGMVLWLMADGAVQNATQYLPDYSGQGNDAWQPSATARPVAVPNILNGKPVLHFSGTPAQWLNLPNVLNGATAGHAFVVLRASAKTGNNSGLWNFGSGNYAWYTNSAGSLYDSFGSTGSFGAPLPARDITQFNVYEVCTQAGSWQSWLNGVPIFSTNSNTVYFTSTPVLGANAGNYGFVGDMAEVVVFNRALSTAERQGLMTYFNLKYALIPPPAAPEGLTVTQLAPTQNLVSWNWQVTDNQTSFVIQRKTGSSGTYSTIATVQGSGTYLDNSVVAGQQYFYQVYAVSAGGSSVNSEEVGVSTPMSEGGSVPQSGMKLWLMADGAWESPVGYLADYSGNGNDAWQYNAPYRPTLASNSTNGKAILHFNGSGQSLNLPNVLNGATAAEALIVVRASSATGNNSALWNFGSGNWSWYANSTGLLYDSFGTTSSISEGTPSQDITQFHVYQVCTQAGSWQSWMDGIPLFETTTNTVSFTATPVLGYNPGGYSLNGDIAEVVIYNRPLSAAERTGLLAYLSQKYALVAPPATPTGLSAVALNSSSAMVTWNSPVTNSSTYFSLWRQQDGNAPVLVTTLQGLKTYIDTAVVSTSTYSYQVQAMNNVGSSALSAGATLQWNMPSVSSLPTSGMKLWIMGDGAWETPVGYLPDYSGNGNDAWQISLANRPSLMQNALNGRPVMHFAGATVAGGQTLNFPNFLSGATAAEALIVLRASSKTVNNSGLWNFGNPGNYSWYALSNGVVYEVFGSNTQFNEGSPSQDITQFHVYDMSSQAGSWQSWLDGVQLVNSTSNTFYFPTNPILGANPGTYGFTGDVAEMVIYNRALTTQERQAWQQYFAIKYLLSNFDPDGDGLTTGQELQLGLNPLNAYTYGGTVNDGAAYTGGLLPLYPNPLYPNPNGPPGGNPLSPGPGVPVITLTSPAGVVLH